MYLYRSPVVIPLWHCIVNSVNATCFVSKRGGSLLKLGRVLNPTQQSLTGSSSDGTTSSRGASPCRSEPPTTITSRVVPVKKRPAPPPPLPASPPPSTQPRSAGVLLVSEGTPLVATGKGGGKREGGPTHSRQSSDSSGYHEASVLSDLPDTPSPEAAIGRPPSNGGSRCLPLRCGACYAGLLPSLWFLDFHMMTSRLHHSVAVILLMTWQRRQTR